VGMRGSGRNGQESDWESRPPSASHILFGDGGLCSNLRAVVKPAQQDRGTGGEILRGGVVPVVGNRLSIMCPSIS
jgi:hypothetical protein